MSFEQATIKIERAEEFGQLKRAIEAALSRERVERLLKRLGRDGIRIRDFDAVLTSGVLEGATGGRDLSARQIYEALTLSDQAQMREFYLFRIEEVDPALRTKFHKLYQYY